MRMKHMRMRMHLVVEVVRDKHFVVEYVLTLQMFADGLTKISDGADFDSFANRALDG